MTSGSERRLDAGLLLLRIGAGLSLLLLFGLQKLKAGALFAFAGQPWEFVDFNRRIGLPAPVLIAYCQSLNESVCALFVAVGFLTRLSATLVAIGFAAATVCSLKANENLLFPGFYCLMFATVALTGAGKFAIDHVLKSRTKAGIPSESSSQ
jgi:uncharacterized membrane protein YphA (DoxX/SURF4 family)